jgi:ribonucleoside-diphosphate reductase subunit M1
MYEISQRVFLQLAADRGRYIDQSQSTNIYLEDPTNDQLAALHQYTSMLGLKTGMYYLRTKPMIEQVKFTEDLEIKKLMNKSDNNLNGKFCSNEEGCLSCQ